LRRVTSVLALIVLFAGFSSSTVTSADSISYNSNNEFFDGDVYAISVTADQATDKIDINIGASELSEKVDGEVNQNLQIDFTSQNTELKYSTTSSPELRNVRTVAPYHEEDFSSEQDAIDAIKSKCMDLNLNGEGSGTYSSYYDFSDLSYNYEIFCFQKNKYLGTPAYIDNPDEIFTAKAELVADGKTVQSATLSNGDAGVGAVTDLGQHAKIRWNGNLDTGAAKPDNTRVLGLYSNKYANGWKVVNQQTYEDYKTYIGGGQAFDNLESWRNAEMTGTQAANLVNDRAQDAASEASSSTSELVNAEVSDSSFNTGSFTFDTEDLLSYPSFTVYVDAGENGYIEVTKPTGTPEILSTSGAEIKEGDEGQVQAIVENVGDGEGQFSARLSSCGEGFSIVDDQDTKTIPAGQSVSFSFDVAFGSVSSDSKEVSKSCTLEVNGVDSSDSTSVSVTGVQQSECSPGDERREQRSDGRWEIYVCQDNGLGYDLDRTCADDEKAVAQGDNLFACEKEGDESGSDDSGPDSSGLFSGLFEGYGSGSVLGQVHTALSILAGVVAGFFGYRTGRWVHGEHRVKGGFKVFESRSLSRVKRGSPVAGIVGAVVGFAVGFLVASLFHPVVQILVVLGVGVIGYYVRG